MAPEVEIMELKTWPVYFDAILDGRKTFEVRKDDRNFHDGMLLCLKRYDPDPEPTLSNFDHYILVKVTYMLSDPQFVLPGMVVMGIKKLTSWMERV